MKRIAFPAISCGIFRYPISEAAAVAFEVCAALVRRTGMHGAQAAMLPVTTLRVLSGYAWQSEYHVALHGFSLQTVKGHAGGLKEVAFLLHDQPAWDGFCRTAAAIAGAASDLA